MGNQQYIEQLGKVDITIAGHGEGAVDDAVREAPHLVARQLHHRLAHVLEMHVADAVDVFAQDLDGLAAAHVAMARIEQQADFRARSFHKLVNVFRGLDVGAHMVVIRQAHALGQGETRQLRELVGVVLPGVLAVKTRAFDQAHLRGLDRVGDFAVHQHVGAIELEQLDMAGDGFDFFGHRTARQAAGVPAGDQRQVIRAQHITDALGVLGELAVEFKTFVADFLAFTERCAQRRFTAQGRQVVVAPGDRVDANSDCGHGCTFCFYLT